ncbi:hypothetical protein JTB14_010167 [Gonioctena quinquepunctata]|nr:hypothetical protein JTB14_010167 [Gonioctena quinquepunctata]
MSSQEDINPDSSPDTPSAKNSKDAFFDPKPKPKIIRVLTVLAYVLSVSMAAILLSIYYIFMWDGKPHIGAQVSGPDLFERTNLSSEEVEFQTHPNYQYVLPQDTANSFHSAEKNRSLSLTDSLTRHHQLEENDTDVTSSYSTSFTSIFGTTTEMQQQFIAVESEQLRAYTTSPTTEENTTYSNDYESLEVGKNSIFIKKLMGNYEEDY